MGETLYEYCMCCGKQELLQQWDAEQNGTLTPWNVTVATHRKVWWRCEKGHAWQAVVESRTVGGAGCPYCTGKRPIPGETDLASRFPDLAMQWHPEENGGLMPSAVTVYSNRSVWWRCERGHVFRMPVFGRTVRGRGCPYCTGRKVLAGFNDLATREPQVAAQWHPTLNGTLTPQMVTVGSHAKVWWQCSEGHVWQSTVYSRAGKQKCGCPVCAGKVKKPRIARYTAIMAEQR